MTEFAKPVTPVEFIIPFIASSILLVSILLMAYLFLKFRKRYDYLILACIGFGAFLFSLFIAMMTLMGGLYMNAELGMKLYRISQTGATFVMMSMIPYCTVTFKLNPNIHRVLNIIAFINIVCGTFITVAAFTVPDLFLSITKQHEYAFLYNTQSMWGRGTPGVFYSVRNLLNAFTLGTMIYCACYDMFVNKIIKDRISIFIAIIIFVFGAAEDLYAFETGTYIVFPNILYSRFATSIVVFTVVVVMHTFKYFLDSSLVAKKTQLELQNKQKKNNSFMQAVKTFTGKISAISGNLEETSSSLKRVSEKIVDSLVITKLHSGASHQASGEFSKIASIQKNHIDEVITFTSTLFNSLSDVRHNINNQKNNISDTIEYTSKLAFTMDSMNDATENITSMSASIKEYTLEKKKNIIDAFKKFEDVTNITGQILNSIDFIKDIAHKTNLLSINSGIQASKAGAYGRGFSVLSREIRDLSSSTHLGTQEIEALLINIANTLKGVSGIRNYVLGSFDSIIKHVNETTTTIDEIVTYMKFQAEKNEFLKLNIQMLDSSSEVIDSSIGHQNEYAIYVQKNMNIILKDFEDISNMSFHQTRDLDSIDKDITTVSKIGKELYQHSDSIVQFYNTMNAQNDTMIDIIEKYNLIVKSTEDREIDEIFELNKPRYEVDDERLVDSQKSLEELFSVDEDFVMDDDYVSFDDKEEAMLNGVRSIDDIFMVDNEPQYLDKGDDIDIDSIMQNLEQDIVLSERSIEELFVPDEGFDSDPLDEELSIDIDKIINEIEEEVGESEKSIEDLFVLSDDNIDASLNASAEIDAQFAQDYLENNVDVDKILMQIEDESAESQKSLDELFVLDEEFVAPGVVVSGRDEEFDVDRILMDIERERAEKGIIDSSDDDMPAKEESEDDIDEAMGYLHSVAASEFQSDDTANAEQVDDEDLINRLDSIAADYTSSIESSSSGNDNELIAEDEDSNSELRTQDDGVDLPSGDRQVNFDDDTINYLDSIASDYASSGNIPVSNNGTADASGGHDDALSYLNTLDIDEFKEPEPEVDEIVEAEEVEEPQELPVEDVKEEQNDDTIYANEEAMSYLDSIAADYASSNGVDADEEIAVDSASNMSGGHDDALSYLDSLATSEFNGSADESDKQDEAALNDTSSYLNSIADAEYSTTSNQPEHDPETLSYLDSIIASEHTPENTEEHLDEEQAQELADLFDNILSAEEDKK